MGNLDPTTIVFAIVAIFVVVKLRSVLGTRTGNERRPIDVAPPPPAPTGGDNVVAFDASRRGPQPPPFTAPAPDRWRGIAEPGTPLEQGLDAVAAAERFSATDFLSGARSAYEMIVAAFAAGDLTTLRRLLAPEVLANFAGAIEARRAAGQTMSSTLVSLDKAEIVDARVVAREASIAVRFAAKLITSTKDSSGATVEGSDSAVANHLDIWTFSRLLGAADPNWLLTATQTVH